MVEKVKCSAGTVLVSLATPVAPGIYRGLFNHGEEEALMCVMLGTHKPHIPTYPEDHPLAKVKRN